MKSTNLTPFAALLGLSLLMAPVVANSEEPKIEVTSTEAPKEALEQLKGKTVTLRLTAGEDVSGTVESVGPTAVKIGQLTGKEFYSALVKIENIAAIIYRAK